MANKKPNKTITFPKCVSSSENKAPDDNGGNSGLEEELIKVFRKSFRISTFSGEGDVEAKEFLRQLEQNANGNEKESLKMWRHTLNERLCYGLSSSGNNW